MQNLIILSLSISTPCAACQMVNTESCKTVLQHCRAQFSAISFSTTGEATASCFNISVLSCLRTKLLSITVLIDQSRSFLSRKKGGKGILYLHANLCIMKRMRPKYARMYLGCSGLQYKVARLHPSQPVHAP